MIPKIVKGERADLAEAAIPVAGAMGIETPEKAALLAETGAYVTLGIPGGKATALKVGKKALAMIEYMGK